MDTLPARESVVEALGLRDLSFEKQNEVFAKLQGQIVEKINQKVFESLNEEDKNELERIQDEDPAALDNFLKSRIPDLPILMTSFAHEVIEDFKTL